MTAVLIVRAGALHAASGVGTYVNSLRGLWPRDGGAVVEICERAPAHGAEATARRGSRDGKALRLLFGYLRTLAREWRQVRRQHVGLRRRLILVNEFGCETLPTAVRLALPFSRIVAVAHTRPGQDERARHWVRRMVERACRRSVSDVIFNSEALKRQWERKLGARRIQGTVIHHGIAAPDRTMPDDYPARPAGTVDFVCVARFVRGKGHRELLYAWRAALDLRREPAAGEERKKGSDQSSLRLLLVGDGPERAPRERLVTELGLTDSVVFLGERQDGARYFNGCDVGVLLSIEPEAFGLVLLEAMSRGKPIIASRLGGIPEVVADGREGMLVDPQQPGEVAEAIVRVASDPAMRARMGESAHQRWLQDFTLDRMFRDYRRYFSDALTAEA
ncbi:MAG: glycosyltransferase family 4 protein [Verrucomicrobiota bacterium]|nr:glycosyltransferase family 4 protein [Verrucomicrobiota bacterium]